MTRGRSDPWDGWVPFRIKWTGPSPEVHWCHVGSRRFAEPFFEESLARAMTRPFSAAFVRVTPIEALTDPSIMSAGIEPSGFIFHMSRCGSTLLAQTLAAPPRSIVLSEPGPIDAVLQAPRHFSDLDESRHVAWLRGMVAALGRRRNPEENRLFLKFDCCHTLDLPFLRRAFPAVPWVFVYRDPVEVIVSHLRQTAVQMMPGVTPPERFGLDFGSALTWPHEEYCARVLVAINRAAITHQTLGDGMFVSYRDLPEAAWGAVSNHFRVGWSEADLALMHQASRRDTKNPGAIFQDDTRAKQSEADEWVRGAAERWLRPLHNQMEALRTGVNQAGVSVP